MTNPPVSPPDKPAENPRALHRERRLKAALKANMAKRKQQVRRRGEDEATGIHNEKE